MARDPFGLVMIDLDEFKTVNDSLGHQAGDRLLREIADAILAAARETDAVFRYGGDEFVVILPRTDADGLMAAAERILQAAESVGGEGSAWHAEGVRVGASIGTASFPDDGETPEDVLLAADRACFVAKRRGPGPRRHRVGGSRDRERVRAVRADAGRSADRRGGLTGARGRRHHRFAMRVTIAPTRRNDVHPSHRHRLRHRDRPIVRLALVAGLAVVLAGCLPAAVSRPTDPAAADAAAHADPRSHPHARRRRRPPRPRRRRS